jgi:hypothetical protein
MPVFEQGTSGVIWGVLAAANCRTIVPIVRFEALAEASLALTYLETCADEQLGTIVLQLLFYSSALSVKLRIKDQVHADAKSVFSDITPTL